MAEEENAGKHPINIRLSAEGLRLVDRLKGEKGISRTAVIELAIRAYAKAEMEPVQEGAG